jgi:hypothetical protein
LKYNRFGATSLQRYFGEQLWEKFRETFLGNNFGKLSGIILRINYFEEN